MNQLHLRQASSSDLELLLKYTLELHQYEDDGQLKSNQSFHENLLHWLTNELNNPLSLYLIAEVDKTPVGFIGATTLINDNGFLENPTKGLIQLIWIENAFRKNGIAKKLLSEIEKCFIENGIKYAEAVHTSVNPLAEKFWNQMGYRYHSSIVRKIFD